MVKQIYEMFLDIDVRSVLPAIRVPTLVLHRRGDRVVNWRAGRWLADQVITMAPLSATTALNQMVLRPAVRIAIGSTTSSSTLVATWSHPASSTLT